MNKVLFVFFLNYVYCKFPNYFIIIFIILKKILRAI